MRLAGQMLQQENLYEGTINNLRNVGGLVSHPDKKTLDQLGLSKKETHVYQKIAFINLLIAFPSSRNIVVFIINVNIIIH